MVTLGTMHPAPFQQAFHGAAGACEDPINFHSFELALNDVAGDMADPSVASADPAEERASPGGSSKPARRGSILLSAPSPDAATEAASSASREGEEHGQGEATSSSSSRQSVFRQSSAHRLFRAAPPEPKQQQQQQQQQQWSAPHSSSDDSSGGGAAPSSGGDRRLRSSSWNSDSRQSPPSAPPGLGGDYANSFFPKRRGRDDKEIMDGSDVLQQISNLTSTQPSNEREVFVGGLRESEDAVHITEEELATYFAKFGVIESVSINRDDRTQRGRGFAFVKFFQESAALNAVVADASTHVIRGTTVSVQWSRGAKDAGNSDRPRRRNSGNSNASSGNGSSPPRGGGRSSSKMGMFPHKGGGGGRSGGGGGGGTCGVGCSHGFSPMRSRGAGHMHPASAGTAGAVPYGYGGGGHGDHNQPMVCVVVPAQRAAALGLAPHPTHHLHSPGTHTSRGSPPQDAHFSPVAPSGGGGHAAYPFHARPHSQGHGGGGGSGGGGGGGGYGVDHHLSSSHHVSPNSGHHVSPSSSHHTSPSSGHHVSPNGGRSYGGAPSMHMPPMHREGRGRAEPRDYPSPANSGGGSGGGGGGSPSYADYERSLQQPEPAASYVMPEWGYDEPGASRGSHAATAAAAPLHNVVRSHSPPANMRRSTVHAVFGGGASSRNGGGAPRPPAASPRAYDGHYSSTRYNGRSTDGFSVTGISSGGVAMRRRSESSAMIGRSSIQRDAIAAAASYYHSVDDMGKDDALYGRDHDLGYGGPPPRLP